MATITTFEELGIWQKARELCKDVWALTQKGSFSRDFGLKDQINRSSGSCMDNIAEGFERDGNKEFGQFLSISKGSVGETRSQMYRALDRGHVTQDVFDKVLLQVQGHQQGHRQFHALPAHHGHQRQQVPAQAFDRNRSEISNQ